MRYFYLILSFLLCSADTYSQGFNWVKTVGGTDFDSVYAMSVDASGNTILVGGFLGTVDFDPSASVKNLTATGLTTDAFVQKLDAAGNLLWAYSLGSTGYDFATSVATDASGNIYIAGTFVGTVDFDPGTPVYNLTVANGNENPFLVKLNASGAFVWAKQETPASGYSNYTTNNISVGVSGSTIYIVYEYRDRKTIHFSKYDNTGTQLWHNFITNTAPSYSYYELYDSRMATDASGNLYIAGCYYGEYDFDPGAGTLIKTGRRTGFVAKYNASGAIQWENDLDLTTSTISAYEILPSKLAIDNAGNLIISAYINTTSVLYVDADPGTGVQQATSPFVIKWSSAGNYIWMKDWLGVEAKGLAVDASNNVYVTGAFGQYFYLTSIGVTLDSGPYPDGYVLKLASANGDFVWVKQIGGAAGWAGGMDIAVKGSDIYTTGVFADNTNFNFDPLKPAGEFRLSNGSSDVYLAKYSICSPATATYTRAGNALTANGTASSNYYWINCANGLLETNTKTFTLTVPGNYKLKVETNGCYDSTSCTYLTPVGINELYAISDYNLYPNPTTGEVNIELAEHHATVVVEIKNILGQIVCSKTYTHTRTIHTAIDGNAGLYFVNVKIDGLPNQTVKIVKSE